ncbi:MAG: AAA family ATPase [Henriciella sp.]
MNITDDLLKIIPSALAIASAIFSIGYFFGKRNTEAWTDFRKLKNAHADLQTTQEKSDRELKKCRAERAELAGENRKYNALRKSLLGNDEDLWLVHDNKPHKTYDADMGSGDLEVITVMNLKGGVGKTTLAANLAAHFDTEMGKRVLIIDLDFQGSATTTLLATSALGSLPDVKVDHLFEQGARQVSPNDVQLQLAGSPLQKTFLVPCGYSFTGLENRMMVQWLLKESEADPRYILAEYLYREDIRNKFDVVIIDAPPRLSLGAVNALTASQSLIIPTIPDRMSVEAVRNFVMQANSIKPSLNSYLNRAFFVCNRANGTTLSNIERPIWEIVEGNDVSKAWRGIRHVVPTIIPRRAAFANATFNRTLAYFQNDTNDPSTPELLKAFGNDIARELNNV